MTKFKKKQQLGDDYNTNEVSDVIIHTLQIESCMILSQSVLFETHSFVF
jgi:hypothetical protein